MSDIVRLPGGKVMTRSRAFALGLVDASGTITAKGVAFGDTQGQKAVARAEREAAWRQSQGLPPIEQDADPEVEASRPKRRKVKPLVPQNVKGGVPVTDPDELAAIAERTAAIEAAREAKAEDGDGLGE